MLEIPLELAPHGLVSACFLVSFIPRIPLSIKHNSQLMAHLALGAFYLLCPSFFLGITVKGDFNTLHYFLQAFCAAFHIGMAYSVYREECGAPVEQSAVFARAAAAFFCLFTRLFAAWHLSEKSTRGLLISEHFLLCTLLSDGIWFLSELCRLFSNKREMKDEVDLMCKRTTLWLEGRGSFYVENALYLDAALSLIMAMFHFAFPQHILKLVIKPEHTLDSHHLMWCRLFGCLSLWPALSSLQARNYPTHTQLNHLAARLVTQTVVFVLNIFGHWILGIYSPNHITAFMISGFYMSFLFSTYYRMKKHYHEEVDESKSKKTVTTTHFETKTVKSKAS